MKTHLHLFYLIAAGLILAACSPALSPADEPAELAPSACPDSADGQIYTSAEAGYCFEVPNGYSLEPRENGGVNVFVGSILNTTQPRAFIEVSAANGQTTQGAADALAAQMPGFALERRPLSLGKKEAVLFTDLPGQDENRQVLSVHDDRLYHITVIPFEPGGEHTAAAGALYDAIVSSFAFVPRE